MKLPNFIIIGAAKAGTTSLYALLESHRDIFMPTPKEPEFFARDDHYAQGIDSYAALFERAEPHQRIGEASTLYSLAPYFDQTPKRIKAHLPDVKLIYVMREPVARAYSFYVQLIKNYQNVTGDRCVHRTFEEFIDPVAHQSAAPRSKVLSPANAHLPDDPDLCLAGSDYVQQIDKYLEHFVADQILFASFEDFVGDRVATLRRITDFIGVDPLDDSAVLRDNEARNVSKDHFDGMGADMATEDIRKQVGALWALRKMVPAPVRNQLKSSLGRRRTQGSSHVPAPMKVETHTRLRTRFASQRAALEARTGLDLSAWQ